MTHTKSIANLHMDLTRCYPVTPYASKAWASNIPVQQWLDQNVHLVLNTWSGKALYRGVLNRPQTVFMKPNPRIVNVLTAIDSVSWSYKAQYTIKQTPQYGYFPTVMRMVTPLLYTQLPPSCTDSLDIVDFGNSEAVDIWTISGATTAIVGRRGSVRAGIIKTMGLQLRADTQGSFSFFGPEHKAKEAFEQNAPSSMQGILLENLYRGSKPATAIVTTVTKSQVLDGRAIFLYQANTLVIEQSSVRALPTAILSLGCFIDYSQMVRYKKAREFIIDLIETIEKSPLKFFAPAEYEKLVAQYTQQFGKYWDGFSEVLDVRNSIDAPQEYDAVAQALTTKEYLQNKDLRVLETNTFLTRSKSGKAHSDQEHAIKVTKAQIEISSIKVEKAADKIGALNQLIKDDESDISLLEKRVNFLKTACAKNKTIALPALKTEAQSKRDDKKELEEALVRFKDQLTVTKKTLDDEYQKFLNAQVDINYQQSFANKNILITDMLFRNKITNITQSVKVDPSIALSDNWYMSAMQLVTLAPSKIYVDRIEKGHSAEVVVAGPYEIDLRLNEKGVPQMAIRLASFNSVFGKIQVGSEWRAKPHPHTDSTVLRNDIKSFETFVTQWKSCCLGSTEGTIQLGMQQANPKVIIAAVLSWLTSANTDDQWGSDYHWFVREKDVRFPSPTIINPIKKIDTPVSSAVDLTDIPLLTPENTQ